MAQYGTVMQVRDESMIVKIERHEACQKCGACSHAHESKEMSIEVVNKCQADVGDLVEIFLPTEHFLKAAWIMYGLPFLAFMIGIAFGWILERAIFVNVSKEPLMLISGFLFMVVTFGCIHAKERTWRSKKYKPVAIRKI